MTDGSLASWADVMPCPGSMPTAWFCGYGNVARCNDDSKKQTFSLAPGYFADFRNSTSTGMDSFPSLNQHCSSKKSWLGVEIGTPLAISLVGVLLLLCRERRLRKSPRPIKNPKSKKRRFRSEELEASSHYPQEADSIPKTHFEIPSS